ncbi:MAG TPA: hypothetical protein VM936_00670 [Pyrinomonadaceae bacterium]|jgi:hypothetical protein|nr:hypothetical protein [Pyrinomonadaceae bacterium]
MRLLTGSKGLLIAALAAAAALSSAGCQSSENTNAAANANSSNANQTVNINSNTNANVATSTITTSTGQTIEAREPDKYSATVSIAGSTAGQQRAAGQAEVKVARNGADRRYAVDTKLPGVGEVIYLEKGDKHYVIMPARKQYAELTQEMTGVNMDAVRAMTPGQIVAFVTRQQGVERVGEETLNTRPVIKYRAAGKTQTQSSAGQVQGESFIYVDKETGLPLRVEGFSVATGNVQGVSGGNLVAEMRDLKTDVDPTQFELPQGFKQITPEEVKQQMAQLTQLLQAAMSFVNQQQQQNAAPKASPTATP